MSKCQEILNLHTGKKFNVDNLKKFEKKYPDSTLDKKRCDFGTDEQRKTAKTCKDDSKGKHRVYDTTTDKCVVPTAKMCKENKIIEKDGNYFLVTKKSKGTAVPCDDINPTNKKDCNKKPKKCNHEGKACNTKTGNCVKITAKQLEDAKFVEKDGAYLLSDKGKKAAKTVKDANALLGVKSPSKGGDVKPKDCLKEGKVFKEKSGKCVKITAEQFRLGKFVEKDGVYMFSEKGKSLAKTVKEAKALIEGSEDATISTKEEESSDDATISTRESDSSGTDSSESESSSEESSTDSAATESSEESSTDSAATESSEESSTDSAVTEDSEDHDDSEDSGSGKKPAKAKKAAKGKAKKEVKTCMDKPKQCLKEDKVCREKTGKCVNVTADQLKNSKFVERDGTYILAEKGKSLAKTAKEAKVLMKGETVTKLKKCAKGEIMNLDTLKCNKKDSWTDARLKRVGKTLKSVGGVMYVGPKKTINDLIKKYNLVDTQVCENKVLDADSDRCISKEKAVEKAKTSAVGETPEGDIVVGTPENVEEADATIVTGPKKRKILEALTDADEDFADVEDSESSEDSGPDSEIDGASSIVDYDAGDIMIIDEHNDVTILDNEGDIKAIGRRKRKTENDSEGSTDSGTSSDDDDPDLDIDDKIVEKPTFEEDESSSGSRTVSTRAESSVIDDGEILDTNLARQRLLTKLKQL